MWDLIVSVPDHCLSFYFKCKTSSHNAGYCDSFNATFNGNSKGN